MELATTTTARFLFQEAEHIEVAVAFGGLRQSCPVILTIGFTRAVD